MDDNALATIIAAAANAAGPWPRKDLAAYPAKVAQADWIAAVDTVTERLIERHRQHQAGNRPPQ